MSQCTNKKLVFTDSVLGDAIRISQRRLLQENYSTVELPMQLKSLMTRSAVLTKWHITAAVQSSADENEGDYPPVLYRKLSSLLAVDGQHTWPASSAHR